MNIAESSHRTFKVFVRGDYIGTFKNLGKALDIRDETREKLGMPKLNDRTKNNSGIRWYAETIIHGVRHSLGAFSKRKDADIAFSKQPTTPIRKIHY